MFSLFRKKKESSTESFSSPTQSLSSPTQSIHTEPSTKHQSLGTFSGLGDVTESFKVLAAQNRDIRIAEMCDSLSVDFPDDDSPRVYVTLTSQATCSSCEVMKQRTVVIFEGGFGLFESDQDTSLFLQPLNNLVSIHECRQDTSMLGLIFKQHSCYLQGGVQEMKKLRQVLFEVIPAHVKDILSETKFTNVRELINDLTNEIPTPPPLALAERATPEKSISPTSIELPIVPADFQSLLESHFETFLDIANSVASEEEITELLPPLLDVILNMNLSSSTQQLTNVVASELGQGSFSSSLNGKLGERFIAHVTARESTWISQSKIAFENGSKIWLSYLPENLRRIVWLLFSSSRGRRHRDDIPIWWNFIYHVVQPKTPLRQEASFFKNWEECVKQLPHGFSHKPDLLVSQRPSNCLLRIFEFWKNHSYEFFQSLLTRAPLPSKVSIVESFAQTDIAERVEKSSQADVGFSSGLGHGLSGDLVTLHLRQRIARLEEEIALNTLASKRVHSSPASARHLHYTPLKLVDIVPSQCQENAKVNDVLQMENELLKERISSQRDTIELLSFVSDYTNDFPRVSLHNQESLKRNEIESVESSLRLEMISDLGWSTVALLIRNAFGNTASQSQKYLQRCL